MDRESNIDSLGGGGIKPETLQGTIEFRNLEFAYPSRPDAQVLRGLDLTMPANKTTAIVGASGSGKSTIVGLIERWFTPLGGEILIDGRPVEDYNLQWLRTNIRLVQQVSQGSSLRFSCFLFTLTLAHRNRSYLTVPSLRTCPMALLEPRWWISTSRRRRNWSEMLVERHLRMASSRSSPTATTRKSAKEGP